MADENEDAVEDGETEDGAKKGGLKKLILFVGLPAVILVLAGVAGALVFLGGGEDEAVAEAEGEHGEAHAEAPADPAAELNAYFDQFESRKVDLTVNIAGENGRSIVLAVEFEVLFTDHAVGAVLDREDVQNRAKDTLIEFMRTLRTEDLDGSMGTYRVKAEALRRMNLVIAPLRA
ncbi:MAG: flagellar basal body-associated FliL family protein, partial [Oceanicaulis sp.]